VPLVVGEAVKGYVSLQNVDREHAFSDSDVRLLTTLANSMSVALENARLFDETSQRNAELAVINSVQEGLVRELEMQAIYDLVGDRLRDLFDAQVVVIRTYDHEAGMEHYRYVIEKGQRFDVPPQPIDGVRRHLIESKAPLFINEQFVEAIQPYTERKATKGDVPKSAIYVPMIVGETVRGDVSLQNVDREHAFSESDLRLLTTLANSMSVALENARLFDETNRLLAETEQRAAELDTVNHISRALVAQLEFDALVQLVGEQMRETFRASIVYVALHDRETDMIHFPYEFGDVTPSRPFGSGLTEKIITTRESLLINRDMAEVRAQLKTEQIGKVAASYLGVPILVGEEAIGVISVQSTEEEGRFDEDDLRLLTTIAANVGVALQNAEAYRQLNAALDHLRATQEQLVQQEKLASLGALTAGIAHEIKNPLNFVNNFAQLCAELADELDEELDANRDRPVVEFEEELKEILSDLKINAAKIEEHGRRADNIVKSMLQHSRGTVGERQTIDVNALLDEYLNLAYHGMRAQVANFNVTLERDYDAAVGTVEAVPQELGQVLINLLNNAFYAVHDRKLSDDGQYAPTVSVGTRKRKDAVEIRVQDNGSGIPEDVKAKIFEPFFTTKPTGSGTGLGLSVSYDIITQRHGGALAVESAEGQGATFVITLPVSTP
jgi:signal transduction histidine kinase